MDVLVPFLNGAILFGNFDQLVFNGLELVFNNLFIEFLLVILHPELEVVLPSWLEVHFLALNDFVWYESKIEKDHDHV